MHNASIKSRATSTGGIPSAEKATIFVVGDIRNWQQQGRLNVLPDRCLFIEPNDLSQEVFLSHQPSAVFSSLMANCCDAMEIAQRLQEIGYAGPYRVIGANIPNTRLIREEIVRVAPDVDFDILSLRPAANV